MPQHVVLEIEMPAQMDDFRLPSGVDERLQNLLDRQDSGEALSDSELKEAEGLVTLTEMLSLLRLRAQRVWREQHSTP